MPTKRPKRAQKQPTYWIAATQDLPYNFTGLGTTQTEAEQAVWNKFKSTNNRGYGLPPVGAATFADFRDNYMSSFSIKLGEAVSE